MSRRVARGLLAVSCLVLAGVIIVATIGRGGRADLVGPPVRVATAATPSPSTTAPPPDPLTPPREQRPPDPVAAGLVTPPPTQLRIEAIGVDDPVVTVGLDGKGSLEIPGVDAVGWYQGSRAPGGAVGSAVLTAHVDYNGSPGVFLQLGRLELGAEIVTLDAAGREHRFQVTERYQVDKDELDLDELFRLDGPPTLTLITCGGAFNERTRHYRDNIVVRAVPR